MTARVLVVDDLVPNVRLLEAKLTAEYYDVVTATDGPTALEIVEKEAPDIVLLDVMMPGMDGFEVCKQIKDNPRTAHVPVVMVTALSDAQNKVRGLEVGADDFLTKPVNDIALLARVRSLVRLKMVMDEWRMREETYGSFGALNSQILEEEDLRGAKILVIDDNKINSNKVVKALEGDSHTVISVTSSQQGFDAFRDKGFDVVVASLLLRQEDGLRLTSQLRTNEESRQIPILLIVEEEDTTRLAKGLDLGANDYIVKPVDPAELCARVRTQVRRKRYQDRLRGNYERSITMALTDSLTGLHNRRYLEAHLGGLIKRAQETQKPLSVLMFDIDHFKQVNDVHGHRVGDEVLQEIANRVRRNVRGFDLATRYGGEEFIVIMPDTGIDVAMTVAERLRIKIAETPFSTSSVKMAELPITVSIGISILSNDCDAPEALVERADVALYQAKNSGRNKVICFETPAE